LTERDREPRDKRLFSYDDISGDPVESTHASLTAYLFDAGQVTNRHLVVEERSRPLCDVPQLVIGSKPIDGGLFIFSAAERAAFLASEPTAEQFMRPFVGSEEYINGGDRWILSLGEASPAQLRSMPAVLNRVAAVRQKRLESPSRPTRQFADTPTRFHVTVIPNRAFLVVPNTTWAL